MPFYNELDPQNPADRRTAAGLIRLKDALDSSIPGKTLDQTLILATWNLREFGGTKSGGRDQEALLYIAEIISHFDLVAVQEVRNNLKALDQLQRMLGNWWKYIVSDVTQGTPGNSERHAFLYDSRKLSFGGLAGELTPPPSKNTDHTLAAPFSAARTPFFAGFRAGWFKFTICTQHLFYGKSKPDDPQRVREAQSIAKLMRTRMRQADRWAKNAILLGDFNIFSTKDQTFLALQKENFQIPDNIAGRYTNASLDKPFDQIALIAPDAASQAAVAKGGVFPFFEYVYRDDEQATYQPSSTTRSYRQWRTYKMSDHLPLWLELQIDFGRNYLHGKTGLTIP